MAKMEQSELFSPRPAKAEKKGRPQGAKSGPPASSARETILAEVTPEQREAIEHEGGPMLVLAGAGSGKTRVITRRVARLIDCGVRARSILSITFTNKAAREMAERVKSLVGEAGARVSTFHSFCARLLREDIVRLKGPGGAAYGRDFVIYDAGDSEDTAKDALKVVGAPEDVRAAAARAAISRWKSALVGPDEARSRASGGSWKSRAIAEAYGVYERLLRERGSLDFDDLLLKALEVLRLDAAAREKWNRRFRYLQVDEYQDTNRIQYELVRLLAGPDRNVTAVGDPDQSIYSWRGAEPGNIKDFLRDFAGARVVKLGSNFRSKQAILDAAGELITKNSGPRAGVLKGVRGEGTSPRVLVTTNATREAKEVALRVERRIKAGRPARDIAVFYRTNAQSRAFEQAMIERGIPYAVVGAVSFYRRREVKDALAYLRVARSPADDVGFRRIVNTPRRGVGPKALSKLAAAAAERGTSLRGAIRDSDALSSLTARARKSLARLDALLGRLAELAKGPAEAAVRAAVEETGLRAMYKATDEDDRVENLDELVSAAFGYDEIHPDGNLADFLEEAALVADIDLWDDTGSRVALMTLHSAKGLEFPAVFIVGVEDGILPHARSLADDAGAIEEERRLLYVGMTRAQDELVLTHARSRQQGGRTRLAVRSRFLDDIPGKLVEVEDLAGETAVWHSQARPGVRRTLRQRAQDEFLAEDGPDDDDFAADEPAQYDEDGKTLTRVRKGMRVRHPVFGVGRVVSVKGLGKSAKVTIDFVGDMRRTVAMGFARLTEA
jgi:DNA helicase-2/ATP-dependent DNA helicase PcrA